MLDITKIIGEVDGTSLYRFEGCKRYCGSTIIPTVFVEDDSGEFTKTEFLFFDRIRTSHASDYVAGVISTRLMSIKGHAIERFPTANGSHASFIDSIPYELHPFNGWAGDEELIMADNAFSYFIDRHTPNLFDLAEYRDKRSDDNDESTSFVKFRGYIGVMSPDFIFYEKAFAHDDIPITEEERQFERDFIFPALEVLRERRLVGGNDRRFGYVDKTSFVDIKEKDRALCFEDMEKLINLDNGSLNLSKLGRRLGLAKDTVCNVHTRIKKEPEDQKSLQKMFFYKVSYGYMEATLNRFSTKCHTNKNKEMELKWEK